MTAINLDAIRARIDLAQDLAQGIFGDSAEAPAGIIDGDTLHDDLLRWSAETGMSLDWILTGEPCPLICTALWARRAAA